MPIQGLTRLRFLQVGEQSALQTPVAATRRVPWRGIPTYNPNRIDPDVDVGSIDPVILPYSGAVDVELTAEGPITFDDLPIRHSAALKGGVTPTTPAGAARLWNFQIASLTADGFDYWTVQHGDDTEATDAIIAHGGVIDVMEETLPEDGGPWTISDQWIFAGGTLGSNATDGLTVDDTPVFAFGTDTAFYKDATPGSMGMTQLTDAVHSATIRVSNNFDRKRFHNGSNTRNQLSGYGRGARVIELVLTVAKTAATIAEANTLDDTPVPNRYYKVSTNSTELAAAANPYTYDRYMPVRLFERADGEIGGNATITLTYRGFYDSTLGYAFRASSINQLTALP
jgi:hypothetical protein